ncbi:hypothetical protein SCLCIDRAFT_697536 [Scleroderma citrinum Foug A]|uniref:Uncharacterized protein n=1 Tax=Scleroderma citrinum Foug A TaxID=1036808 RepID=A0A0C3EMD6_9AGAM|nr:hypothetical protein SCLCIDRAFT_697536 [Scleroderma citrinum Foug A]
MRARYGPLTPTFLTPYSLRHDLFLFALPVLTPCFRPPRNVSSSPLAVSPHTVLRCCNVTVHVDFGISAGCTTPNMPPCVYPASLRGSLSSHCICVQLHPL